MSSIVATEFGSQANNTVLVKLHTSENETLSFVLESVATGPIASALLAAAKDSMRETSPGHASSTKPPTQRISILPSAYCVTSDLRPHHQTLTFEFGRSCIHFDLSNADARQLAEMILLMTGKPVNTVC